MENFLGVSDISYEDLQDETTEAHIIKEKQKIITQNIKTYKWIWDFMRGWFLIFFLRFWKLLQESSWFGWGWH